MFFSIQTSPARPIAAATAFVMAVAASVFVMPDSMETFVNVRFCPFLMSPWYIFRNVGL